MMLEKLTLGETPKIVLSVRDNDQIVRTSRPRRARCPRLFDLVELRVDLFTSLESDALLRMAIPTILTARSKKEGGGFQGSELKRLSLYQKMIPLVSTVDIELSAKTILGDVIDNAHDQKKKVIVSYHDFDKTPSVIKLEKILKKAKASGADIVKVATFAKDHRDIQRLAQFTVANANQNIVTIAMGEIGALSRLFFPALGSLLIYGSFSSKDKDKTGPGQIDCKELSRLIKRFYPKS